MTTWTKFFNFYDLDSDRSWLTRPYRPVGSISTNSELDSSACSCSPSCISWFQSQSQSQNPISKRDPVTKIKIIRKREISVRDLQIPEEMRDLSKNRIWQLFIVCYCRRRKKQIAYLNLGLQVGRSYTDPTWMRSQEGNSKCAPFSPML